MYLRFTRYLIGLKPENKPLKCHIVKSKARKLTTLNERNAKRKLAI